MAVNCHLLQPAAPPVIKIALKEISKDVKDINNRVVRRNQNIADYFFPSQGVSVVIILEIY